MNFIKHRMVFRYISVRFFNQLMAMNIDHNEFHCIGKQNRDNTNDKLATVMNIGRTQRNLSPRLFDFIPNLIPNLKIFHFVTKRPWGFVLSVTVRGNAFIAKQNRLSATARVFCTFAEVLGAKGLFKLHFRHFAKS